MARLRFLCVRLAPVMGLILTLTFTSAAGCGAGGDDGGARKVCDVHPYPPEVEQLGAYTAVVATAVAMCDEPPNTHKIMVMLEFGGAGAWLPMSASATESRGVCEDIPRPGREVKCQWRIFDCEPGIWRTVVHVSGEGPFGPNGATKPFYFVAPEKPEARIKCPDDKRD